MHKRQGFSLIEMLACISIITIICAFALPSMQSMSASSQSDKVAGQLYHHLNLARTEAILRNTITTVCASMDGRTCLKQKDWSSSEILVFHDHNGDGYRDSDDTLVSSINMATDRNGLTWRSFGNKPYLQWQPSGMTYFQNGNLTYCPANGDGRHARRLVLNGAGRVYHAHDTNGDGIPEGSDGKNIRC